MIGATLARLAIHRRQSLGGGLFYVELCPAYIQTMDVVTTSYETARRWWKKLQAAIGWQEVTGRHALTLGVEIRDLKPGARHGRHMVIRECVLRGLEAHARESGALVDTDGRELTWHPVRLVRVGNSTMCRCPHHSDDTPSMQVDVERGRATCHGCGARCRYDRARGVSGSRSSGAVPSVCARDKRTADVPAFCRRWVTGLLGEGGVQWASRKGDLMSVIARRGRDHRPVPDLACCVDLPRTVCPDRLAHLDEQRVASWTRMPWGWMPGSWTPVAVRYLLVDVDDLDSRGMWDDWLVSPAKAIEQWASGCGSLTGRVAVTRTSEFGVQVVAELSQARDPAWRSTASCALAHQALEAKVMATLREAGCTGGHVDTQARGAGRLIRLSGGRVRCKRLDRDPWTARAVYVTGLLNEPVYLGG